MNQYAIATRCLEMPLRRTLPVVAGMGADGVQVDVRHELNARGLSATGRRQFVVSLDHHNLRLATTFFPIRSNLADLDRLDQRVSAIRDAMRFSHELGTETMVVNPGVWPVADSPDRSRLLEVLSELADHGNRVGTTLCLRSSGICPRELRSVLENVKSGPLGIDFDPAGSVVHSGDPLTDFAELHQLVRHVRATDTALAGDNTPVEVPPGQGRVPWLELLVSVAEARFRGWLTLERGFGTTRAADLQAALEYFRSQLPV